MDFTRTGDKSTLVEKHIGHEMGKIRIILTICIVIMIKDCLKIDSRIKRFNNVNPLFFIPWNILALFILCAIQKKKKNISVFLY